MAEQSEAADADTNVRAVALALLAARAPGATVCPSEVARALAAAGSTETSPIDWRDMMPAVHATIDRLLGEGAVRLSWKGRTLQTRSGPYRIGRAARDQR